MLTLKHMTDAGETQLCVHSEKGECEGAMDCPRTMSQWIWVNPDLFEKRSAWEDPTDFPQAYVTGYVLVGVDLTYRERQNKRDMI